MSKNKRMVYIYEENLEFYDGLENKSDFVNDALQAARLGTERVGKLKPDHSDDHPDPRIQDTRNQLSAMEQRDAEALRKYREQ